MFAFRGVIEGFFGEPWPQGERLALLKWMIAQGFDTYIHAPKHDPYQRLRWRWPYPAATLEQFGREIALANAHGLRWIPSISPGLPLLERHHDRDRDICFSAPEDFERLCAKLDEFWDLGARGLMVAFDDTVKESSHPEDAASYGTGDHAYGVMNADLLNRVYERYAARDPDVALITVPVDYFGATTTTYLDGLRSSLRDEVVVMWTGVRVVAPEIGCADADGYGKAVGRKPLLWDNYPVTDYAADRLLVGPYAGRAPDLPDCLAGIVVNPSNKVRANRLPLHTVARYLHDPASYEPAAAWDAALDAVAGDQRHLLEPFADNVRSSPLDRTEAVRFARLRDAFLESLATPDWPAAHDSLVAELRTEQATPARLRAEYRDRALVAELDDAWRGNAVTGFEPAGSWLDRLAFNAANGLETAGYLARTRPDVSLSVEGGVLRGIARLPAGPDETAAALRALEGMRDRDDGNPTCVHGDRELHALGLAFTDENRMDHFFDEALEVVRAYAETARAASADVTVCVDGEPVDTDAEGGFAVEVGVPGAAEVVVTDAAGTTTRRTVPRPGG